MCRWHHIAHANVCTHARLHVCCWCLPAAENDIEDEVDETEVKNEARREAKVTIQLCIRYSALTLPSWAAAE